ncbi:YIP1 family protein [Natronorubrum texcoconense]|uniref:Yip1 domain-containing protein n=1 Tax=Natronorubrum texcoconense TaxID=1095776 RepID=A0A1G9C1V7_9EURY|nr:YIP1 family protein [Natronorubrum texcoconense]SDK45681.1 Yip1 domain-containing protein [Natronorubrum texcoconense]
MPPRTPLFDPAGYFETRSETLQQGLAVFVAYTLLEVVWLSVVIWQLFVPDNTLAMTLNLLVTSATLGGITLLVVAAIMHFGSGGANASGSHTDAVAVAGWAYAPNIVVFVPTALYGWRQLQQLTYTTFTPEELTADIAAVPALSELAAVQLITAFIAILWSIYLLTHGISKTHSVLPKITVVPAFFIGIGSFILLVFGP